MYNKKYIVEKIEEINGHNSEYSFMKYDFVEGKLAYLAYFNVGEPGWFFWSDDGCFERFAHVIRTSPVKNVEYTRGNQIIVTTHEAKLTFTLVMNN